jgi:hypothetical protein
MKKKSNSSSFIDFLEFAYSPTNQNQDQDPDPKSNQRIVNPKKKKITTYGVRYIKNEIDNNNQLKILRIKISN